MAGKRRELVVMIWTTMLMSSLLRRAWSQQEEDPCRTLWIPCLAFFNGSVKANDNNAHDCCYAMKDISQSNHTCLCSYYSQWSNAQILPYCLSLLPLLPPPPPPLFQGSPFPLSKASKKKFMPKPPSPSPINNGMSFDCPMPPTPETTPQPQPPTWAPTPQSFSKRTPEPIPKLISANNILKICIGVASGVVATVIIIIGAYFIAIWKKKQQQSHIHLQELEELKLHFEEQTFFPYEELKIATRNFHVENLLGHGGFGDVYKGVLVDGEVVAVKCLSPTSKQGHGQFLNEVESISIVKHRNLVTLKGWCIEGDQNILVYEFLENGSLDQHLFIRDNNNGKILGWETRYKIIKGVARGLNYLHAESNSKIVHRDIKASNVLLDANLKPKISDFGLARIFTTEETHIETAIAGTLGYLSPEYAMRGIVSDKTDVYSFGILTLEIVAGRKHTLYKRQAGKLISNYILDHAWELYKQGNIVSLVDPFLGKEFCKAEASQAINIALLCTQMTPNMRPTMDQVIEMLLGDIEIGPLAENPEIMVPPFFDQPINYDSKSIWDTFGTSSSNDYLSDLYDPR